MIVRNVVGYMLGNENAVYAGGDRWADCDMPVFICRYAHTATRIMHSSNHPVYHGVRWNTVYRVHADALDCSSVSGDMFWTNQATKIIVDGPVAYHNSKPSLTEEQLCARAATIAPAFHKLMQEKQRRK